MKKLITKISKHKAKAGKAGKKAIATIAAAGVFAGSIFGLAGCKTNNAEYKPDGQTNSQQMQFIEMQEQMKQLEKEMNSLKNDVSKLKENDLALMQLITSNITIVQNSIIDLQKQISTINSQISENKQDIESLKQNQTSIANQLSTLQTNLQNVTTQLETLKGQTSDSSEIKNITDLEKSVSSIIDITNLLIIQNAINTTFATAYNNVSVSHSSKNEDTIGHYYIAPNGDYAIHAELEDIEIQNAVCTDGLIFLKNRNGEEEVRTSDNSSFRDILYSSIKNVTNIVADDDIYTFQQDKDITMTFTLSSDSKISHVTESYFNDSYTYSFNTISQKDYKSMQSFISSHITTFGHYQELCSIIDKSFDYRYSIISQQNTYSNGQPEEYSKLLIGNGDRRAIHYQDGTFVSIGIDENGIEKFIQQSADGEISEEMQKPIYHQYMNMESYPDDLKILIFNNSFKIEYNAKSDTYTITTDEEQGEKQIANFKIDENGKFTSFNVTFIERDGEQRTINCQIEGINKARYEKEFSEMKSQYEELLNKKNENNVEEY